MTSVDVFSDPDCKSLLAQMTVSESFAPDSEDFNDGQDWWNRVIAQVEQTHGSQWQCIVVRSSGGQQGRRFDRHPSSNTAQLVFQPRIFAFSKSQVKQLSPDKAARFYNLKDFDFNKYYWDGTDERIIQHLASVFGCVQEQFTQVMVLEQDAKITPAFLKQHFHVLHAIHLKDQAHYLALESCDASLNQLYQMKLEAQDIGLVLKNLNLIGAKHAEDLEQVLATHLSNQFKDFKSNFALR